MSRYVSDRILGALQAFRTANAGNVAMTFAIAAVPLIGLVGSAVDYSRANAARAAMQAALDSTALMLSKTAANRTPEQLNTSADAYFKTVFTRPEAKNILVKATYTNAGGSKILLSADAAVETSFMGMMGFNTLPIGVSSTAKWGTSRLRVALVLDTTGSMDSAGKITALKSATKSLLDQLQAAATVNGDVYVSIIPFSKNVNLGDSNYNASWIDWDDWESEPSILDTDKGGSKPNNWDLIGPGDACPFTNNNHGFGCAPNPTSTSTTSTIPSSGSYSGYICPSNDSGRRNSIKIGIIYNGCYNSVQGTRTIASGANASCGNRAKCTCSGNNNSRVCTQTYYTHNWVLNQRSTWNGCVTDRGMSTGPRNDYDRKIDAPTAAPESKYPAEQNSYCSPEVTGLTYNWSTLKRAVDALYPLGATNQPIGLVWGWQSLVGGGPLTSPPKDSNYTYDDVIVLMSDGLNTLNRWSGNGSTTNTAVDRRMHETATLGTCANIKAAGVTIYALHVNTDNDPKSTLLERCASSADKFWMVTSASDIQTVFNTIGTNLSRLRLAR